MALTQTPATLLSLCLFSGVAVVGISHHASSCGQGLPCSSSAVASEDPLTGQPAAFATITRNLPMQGLPGKAPAPPDLWEPTERLFDRNRSGGSPRRMALCSGRFHLPQRTASFQKQNKLTAGKLGHRPGLVGACDSRIALTLARSLAGGRQPGLPAGAAKG